MAKNDSGQIVLDGDVIRYRSAVYGSWDLPVAEIRIVGEATNQNGPFADDYFICFATGPGMWLEASFYADGRDTFLRDLAAKIESSLELKLQASADFASRVLWPPSLPNEPMFQFMDVTPKGLAGKLLKKLFGTGENLQTYSDRIAAVLAEHSQPPDLAPT